MLWSSRAGNAISSERIFQAGAPSEPRRRPGTRVNCGALGAASLDDSLTWWGGSMQLWDPSFSFRPQLMEGSRMQKRAPFQPRSIPKPTVPINPIFP